MTWGNENMERMTTIIMNTSEGSITINLFDDEIDPSLKFDKPYLLAMANAGLRRGMDGKVHGTNGSQFFITTVPTPWLDGHHTIFGEVADDDSKKVVDKLEALDTDPMDRPLEPAVILSVDVAE